MTKGKRKESITLYNGLTSIIFFFLIDQYICRRAANAILSEIGPYQLSSDALQTINQFLDQVLALLLQNTQSLEPALVKSQLLALLPLSLGKNALVEAELEVKTYSETHNTHYPLYDESMNEPTPFPLDRAWTSLRYRCIEHSTLTEKSLESPTRSSNDGDLQGMVFSPVVIIYFTAILEHIAEYILTIIAMTAEREGARYIRIKEVYLALVNDGQVGGLFKQTDLQSKLEVQYVCVRVRGREGDRQGRMCLSSSSVFTILLETYPIISSAATTSLSNLQFTVTIAKSCSHF